MVQVLSVGLLRMAWCRTVLLVLPGLLVLLLSEGVRKLVWCRTFLLVQPGLLVPLLSVGARKLAWGWKKVAGLVVERGLVQAWLGQGRHPGRNHVTDGERRAEDAERVWLRVRRG